MTFNCFKDSANLCFRQSSSQNGMAPYVKQRDMNSLRQLQGLMLCRAALCLGPWKGLVFGTLFCCIFYGLEEVLRSFVMQSFHNGSLQRCFGTHWRAEWKNALFSFLYGCIGWDILHQGFFFFQIEVQDSLLGYELPKVMRSGVELWVLARRCMVLVWFLLLEW